MTALADIRNEIERTLRLVAGEIGTPVSPAGQRFLRHERLRLNIGPAAAQSIMAETGDDSVPERIDEVAVQLTDAFNGYELVIL